MQIYFSLINSTLFVACGHDLGIKAVDSSFPAITPHGAASGFIPFFIRPAPRSHGVIHADRATVGLQSDGGANRRPASVARAEQFDLAVQFPQSVELQDHFPELHGGRGKLR